MSRLTLSDPFEAAIAETADVGFKVAGDGDDYYVYDYRRYMRCTKILGKISSETLMMWYAKMAALAAATPLVHAGLLTPDMADAGQSELERYVDGQAIRVIEPAHAVVEACNWQSNMRAAVRYRDHRGRIGTVTHYYKKLVGLGVRNAKPDIEFLAGIASDELQFPSELLERYEMLGAPKTVDELALDVAHHAMPHAQNVWEWHEQLKPEYEHVEVTSFSPEWGYAATIDECAIYDKGRWIDKFSKWSFDHRLTKARLFTDLKTSSRPNATVRFQLAAGARGEFLFDYSSGERSEIEPADGIAELHSVDTPEQSMNVRCWDKSAIDPLFDAFCHLTTFVRALEGLPNARRGTKPPSVKRGARPNPIEV